MTTPLLSGATGDPINLQRQTVPQPNRGVPVDLSDAGWRDWISNGGPVVFEPGEIERLVIAGGGQPQGNLPGKININDITFEIGDVDPANFGIMHFLANLFVKYTWTDNTTWNRWDFALDQTTTANPFLTYREWNDILPGFRLTDLICGGMNITVSPNENLQINFDAIAAEFDFHGLVTQTAGSGSTLPAFKRFWGSFVDDEGNFAADATDQDLFLRIDDAAGLDYSGKVATAGVYSDARTGAPLGAHNRFFKEDGTRAGKLAEQISFFFPTAPTLVDLDEFEVVKRMVKWSQSLGVDRPITSVNTIFILDGVEIRTEGGWEVVVERETLERIDDVAGRQGAVVRKSGDLDVTITPTREAVDLTLQEAILAASQISCVIEAETDVEIGATGKPFRFLQVYPQCRVFGSTFGVEPGGQNRDESARLVPEEPDSTFNYDGMTFDAHAHIVIDNDIAAL